MGDESGSVKSSKVKKMELLQAGATSLYQDKLLFDVKLQAEKSIFPAHKAILAACSYYFRAMFSGGYKESKDTDKPILLEGIGANGLEVVLEAIYTTELKVTTENIFEAVPVVCMLQIQPLIDECEEFMISSISPDRFFTYAETAERYSLKRATECLEYYKKACFYQISKTLGFKELDVAEVVCYLRLPDLYLCGQEKKAFDAAIGWIEHKPSQRKKHTLDVFQCINLLQITATDLREEVSKVNFIRENAECMALTKEALKYHDDVFTQPFYEGNILNNRGIADGMIAFPDWSYNNLAPQFLAKVTNYDEIFGDTANIYVFWKYLSFEDEGRNTMPLSADKNVSGPWYISGWAKGKIPSKMGHQYPVKVGNFLFLFGDQDLFMWYTMSALRYNPMLDDWVTIKPAPAERTEDMCYVQCSEKHIMLVGGEPERGGPISVKTGSSYYYIYSIADNDWKKGKARLELCYFPKAVYHNEIVYVIDGKSLLSYNMDEDVWVKERRLLLSPETLETAIVVGHGENLFIFSDNAAPQEYNIGTKRFSVCPEYPQNGTHLVGAFSHGEYIYYILKDKENKEVKLVQLAHPDKDEYTWKITRKIPCYCESLQAIPMVLPRQLIVYMGDWEKGLKLT